MCPGAVGARYRELPEWPLGFPRPAGPRASFLFVWRREDQQLGLTQAPLRSPLLPGVPGPQWGRVCARWERRLCALKVSPAASRAACSGGWSSPGRTPGQGNPRWSPNLSLLWGTLRSCAQTSVCGSPRAGGLDYISPRPSSPVTVAPSFSLEL